MGELRKEQRHAVAPRTKAAAEHLDPSLPGQTRHQMIGDQIANLSKYAELAANWRGDVVLFFHTGFIAVKSASRQFISFPAMGWLCS
ncbi:MAG: hypothetical protein ACRD5L_00745, partial [Bryobacteraceae bacterium]